MKFPIINRNSDVSESLIKYLTHPARLKQYDSLMPGCAERLFKEAEKQLSHNRKRFWACLLVALILGFFAMDKSPAEVLHTIITGF